MPYPGNQIPVEGASTFDIGLLSLGMCVIGLIFLSLVITFWYQWWRRKVEQRLRELTPPPTPVYSVHSERAETLPLSQVNVAFEVAEGTMVEFIVEALPAIPEGAPAPQVAAPPAPPPAAADTPETQLTVTDSAPPLPEHSEAPPPPILSIPPQPPVVPDFPEVPPPSLETILEQAKTFLPRTRQWLAGVNWWAVAYEGRWVIYAALVMLALLMYAALTQPHTFSLTKAPALPNATGRPFYNLFLFRDTVLEDLYPHFWVAIGGAGGAMILVALACGLMLRRQNKPVQQAWELALASLALTLAGMGQWQLNFNPPHYSQGIYLYSAAVLTAGLWAWVAGRRLAESLRPAGRIRWEILLVTGLLAVTAFARLVAFPTYPYGVEGDEKNWVSEVSLVMVDRQPDFSGEAHVSGVPTSFLMQAPFYALFGVSVNISRFAVICYSILGSLAFFLLLRQLGPWPLAAMGTFLLAVSIADISASRQANVESHVKFWPILALALLAYALQKDRWPFYALSGLALALGLLTFDTVLPIYGVALLAFVIEMLRRRKAFVDILVRLAALGFPLLLGLPFIWAFIQGRVSYYGVADRAQDGIFAAWGGQFLKVLSSWFIQSEFDFIYSRSGPMINAALLPWLVFGIVVALFTLRKSLSVWVLLWAGLVLLPVPSLTDRPVARVYYPGLPAVYALIALGIFAYFRNLDGLFHEMGAATGKALRGIWGSLLLIALFWVGVYNLYLYFNTVSDPQPRQVIRELGEFVYANAGPEVYWLIPTQAGANSQLAAENRTVEIYMHGKVPIEQIPASYEMIHYTEFLPRLVEVLQSHARVEMVFDRITTQQAEQTRQVLAALERCFPQVKIERGRSMDHYSLSAADLDNAACFPTTITLSGPETGRVGTPYPLSWALTNGAATAAELVCERSRTDVTVIQAEDLHSDGGWQMEATLVMNYQGEGLMFDYPDNAPLRYLGELPRGETYVWVRYYKRLLDRWPAMLTVNGAQATFADLKSEDELNHWRWQRLGPFQITAQNNNEVFFTRPFDGEWNEFWAIFLDAVQFTTDPDYTPDTAIPWVSADSQIQKIASPAAAGEITFTPTEAGIYRCQLTLSGKSEFVDALGNTPLWSNPWQFQVPEE